MLIHNDLLPRHLKFFGLRPGQEFLVDEMLNVVGVTGVSGVVWD